ncbi:MAG: hypothetical protein KKH41_04590 [Candidatus Thermoplasmatota archaeon]|nr:hypothetical protein [Euryarchaeota archaeon]MBU4144039.1 hypothetical protein [Candidatus Thermoplasmatota archaeon]MBU4591847.1 hypothetical protein [Candidatus Thermoplasmatota archaeon]
MVEIGGYPFNKPELLKQALTTRDYSKQAKDKGEDNVHHQLPMRTLGDKVLSTLLAEHFYRPDISQKELKDLMVPIERRSGLCILAKYLDFTERMFTSDDEKENDKHKGDRVQAETSEAIIAAVLLDSDYYTCSDVVLGWLRKTGQLPRKPILPQNQITPR